MTISVFLADDHAVVRDGLRFLLEAEGDIKVVGDAADGRHTVQEVAQLRPDVVIVDVVMPQLGGIEATRQIRDRCPSAKVVMLSMYSTAEHIFQAFQAGARGYVLKECAGSEVVNAVRSVHAGNRYMSQKISDALVDDYVSLSEVGRARAPLERLSPREREILQLVVEGRSSADIAEVLFLSPKTVDTYRSRLMRKLGIRDLPSLVKFAIQHGLTPLE
ncbi:MAG: response regulator transcription factor [Anaerolineae bacterium]|nr:response regulator transcription factor [Anaerolineae bacterium]